MAVLLVYFTFREGSRLGLVYREAFFWDVCQRVEANAADVSYVEEVAPLGFGVGLEAGDV